jgi:hypothetical protein
MREHAVDSAKGCAYEGNVREAGDRALQDCPRPNRINDQAASETVDMPSGSEGGVLASLPGFSSRALI